MSNDQDIEYILQNEKFEKIQKAHDEIRLNFNHQNIEHMVGLYMALLREWLSSSKDIMIQVEEIRTLLLSFEEGIRYHSKNTKDFIKFLESSQSYNTVIIENPINRKRMWGRRIDLLFAYQRFIIYLIDNNRLNENWVKYFNEIAYGINNKLELQDSQLFLNCWNKWINANKQSILKKTDKTRTRLLGIQKTRRITRRKQDGSSDENKTVRNSEKTNRKNKPNKQ